MQPAQLIRPSSAFSALMHEAPLPAHKEAILALWCVLEASNAQERENEMPERARSSGMTSERSWADYIEEAAGRSCTD